MIWKVQYSAQAKDDLWGIHDYIAHNLKEPVVAERMVNRILDAVDDLAVSPYGRCFELEPWHSMGMRRINVGNYAVLFIPEETVGVIKIVRVFYGRMDIEQALEKTELD
jgi:toxin ParE1/3/4